MKAYSYNAKTKEYEKEILCQLDPLETKKQGKNIYLLPANATFDKPLKVKTGFAIVWNGSEWEYIEDNRGKEYWFPTDEWDSQAREMKEIGALPDGALFEAPEIPQEEIAAQVRAERNRLLDGTDKLMTVDYPITDEQRELVKVYRQALRDIPQQEGFPFDVVWPELILKVES